MLTKETLEQRLKELETQKQNYIQQANSQLNIIEGAIQNTKFLISELDKTEEKSSKNTKGK